MLVREVLRRVCTLLTDVSPQFVRWSEGELVDWVNDGQLAIARYLPTAASPKRAPWPPRCSCTSATPAQTAAAR